MAYALVAHTKFEGAPMGGTTPPIDTTGANLIVLNTSPNGSGGPTTPTDSFGNTYTLIISESMLAAFSQLWYCFNPIVGPLHTFSSASSTTNFMGISVAAFSGATITNPFNQATGQDGRLPNPPYNGFIQPGPLTPGTDNCLFVVGNSGDIRAVDATDQTIDSGFIVTDKWFQVGFVSLSQLFAYKIQTTAATENPSVTAVGWHGSGASAVTMATFFAAEPPPPPNPKPWSDFEIWAMRAKKAAASTSTSINLSAISATATKASVSASANAAPVNMVAVSGAANAANVSVSTNSNASIALNSVSGISSQSAITVTTTGGGSALLSSFTVMETQGINQPIGFIPQMIGLPFKKGDVPSGTWPILKMHTGGTNVSFSMPSGLVTRWSDGSLKRATFLVRMPVPLVASGSSQIDIYNGGGNPGTSSRSLTDISSNTNFKLEVIGADSSLSGTWTSILNDGISNTNQSGGKSEITDYGDGPVGHVWKIKASFEQSGAAHGQLEGYFYIAVLQDASSGLYGFRLLHASTQPWYNDSQGTKKARVFNSYKLYNGATLIRDCVSVMPSPKTMTWVGSGINFTCTGHNFTRCMGVMITSTGTLPANITAGQIYFINDIDQNTISFSTYSSSANHPFAGSTSAGTGTVTVSPVPYLCWGSALYSWGANSVWDYVQGGGSWAPVATLQDNTTRIVFDKAYWRTTGLMYAWDPTIPTNPNAVNMNNCLNRIPGWPNSIEQAQGSSGEGMERALLSGWGIQHYFNQDAASEKAARAIGYQAGQFPMWLRDFTTGQIPVCNGGKIGGGEYTGMPTSNKNFRWIGDGGDNSHTTGFTGPTNLFMLQQVFNYGDGGHMGDYTYYPFLFTGQPEYADLILNCGNWGLYELTQATGSAVVTGTANYIGATRNPTISGTNYWGITTGSSGVLRTTAWPTRLVCNAAGILPAAYATPLVYLNDVVTRSWQAVNAFNAMQTSWATTNGFYYQAGATAALGLTYFMMTAGFAAKICESSDAFTTLNWIVKYPAYINNTFGGYHVGHDNANSRINDPLLDEHGALLTSDNLFGVIIGPVSWSSSTSTFTATVAAHNYTCKNGNTVIFTTNAGDSVAPGGLSLFTQYYMVNANGGASTFQVSATLGGSPITLTNSGSLPFFQGVLLNPTPNTSTSFNTVDGYNQGILSALKGAIAVGATVDATTVTSLQNIANAGGYDFTGDPQYAYSSSAI